MNRWAAALVIGTLFLASSAAWADDTAAIWSQKCASCHGIDGAGSTRKGKQLKALDYTSAAVQAKFTDAQLRDAIDKGMEQKKMPAYGKELTGAQIDALVKYVRGLKK